MTYQTYVFDCDGVVLDSNRLKTDAFRTTALPFGEDAAQALVAHHVASGGISRFAKFRHFLDVIVGTGWSDTDLQRLVDTYGQTVRDGLVTCGISSDLQALRERTPDARWLIVSGGAQAELRDVFAARGIDHLFDGGIFGSPDTKDEILARELANGNIDRPAIFIGDSRYDWQAATMAGLDFVFASYWTEVENWEQFTTEMEIPTISSLGDLRTSELN